MAFDISDDSVPEAIKRAVEASEPQQPEEPSAPKLTGLARVEKILDSLIPSGKTVEWVDRWDRRHSSPQYATIRQQRRLMGMIRLIAEKISMDPEAMSVTDLIDYLVSEDGIDNMIDVFTLLHEDAIAEARTQAGDQSLAVEDMVSIEEVYRGVIPFCVSPIKKIMLTTSPALIEAGLLL